MELFPAIDLREGRVVRLQRGDDGRRTTYSSDPVATLLGYASAGAEWIHLVDLDAAFGNAPQRQLIEGLVALPQAPRVQLGGGLRDSEAVEWALDCGCARVVLTSLLVEDLELFSELAQRYPHQLVAALDTRDGELQIRGWTESAEGALPELCRHLRTLPIAAVLVTDVERDGMLDGPNLELACELGERSGSGALLSGGVRSLGDLAAASRRPQIAGAVVGRALLDGSIDLQQALRLCSGESALGADVIEVRP